MKLISTSEISEIFNRDHSDVMKCVKSIISKSQLEGSYFYDSKYINSRGKTYPCFDMGVDGFILLTNTRSFNGRLSHVRARVLSEFGVNCRVVTSESSRGEDDFYEMLTRFFSGFKVYREYPIAGFRVDFYIDEINLFVEYDEKHHLSKSNLIMDSDRWSKIQDTYRDSEGCNPYLVRVEQGFEIEGLAAIAGNSFINNSSALVDLVNEETRVTFARIEGK